MSTTRRQKRVGVESIIPAVYRSVNAVLKSLYESGEGNRKVNINPLYSPSLTDAFTVGIDPFRLETWIKYDSFSRDMYSRDIARAFCMDVQIEVYLAEDRNDSRAWKKSIWSMRVAHEMVMHSLLLNRIGGEKSWILPSDHIWVGIRASSVFGSNVSVVQMYERGHNPSPLSLEDISREMSLG